MRAPHESYNNLKPLHLTVPKTLTNNLNPNTVPSAAAFSEHLKNLENRIVVLENEKKEAAHKLQELEGEVSRAAKANIEFIDFFIADREKSRGLERRLEELECLIESLKFQPHRPRRRPNRGTFSHNHAGWPQSHPPAPGQGRSSNFESDLDPNMQVWQQQQRTILDLVAQGGNQSPSRNAFQQGNLPAPKPPSNAYSQAEKVKQVHRQMYKGA